MWVGVQNRVVLDVWTGVHLKANGGGNGISLTGVFVLVGVFVRDLGGGD